MFSINKPVASRSSATGFNLWSVITLITLLPGLLSAADLIDKAKPASIPEEIIASWKEQDKVSGSNYTTAINGIIEKLKELDKDEYVEFVEAELAKAANENAYLTACHWRRVAFLEDYEKEIKKLVYAKHHNLGSLIVGCQEGFSIASNIDEKWKPGSGLYYLDFTNYYPQPKPLIEDKSGVIRDPCVSLDGKKIAFAWYKNASRTTVGSSTPSGYKIFELDIEKHLANPSTEPKQITFADDGLVVSDYEPCYTQFGEIMFNSSRCFQLIDCFTNMVSTIFVVDTSGKYLRRVCYDQVHTFYPQLRSDGKIMYTRWEYNDRNLMQSMGLFTMRPDGTEQTEFYGNQTTWPVTCIHGREIPYTQGSKAMFIASGHHAPYYGEPLIVDITKGRNGITPLSGIAGTSVSKNGGPVTKPTANDPNDSGGVEFKYAFPLPLDEDRFLISYTPQKRGIMSLYAMDPKGHKELIAWADQSVSQPFLVKPRNVPTPGSKVDYSKKTGVYRIEDVYVAGGVTLKGVKKGSIKKIRVCKLEYRHSSADVDPWKFGREGATGWVFIPISVYTGSWQAKRIIGEAPVYEDGSAAFEAPALQPLYFQLIDAEGRMVQTMRSWSTLMPNETFNCIGCHEDKNTAISDPDKRPMAQVKPLEPFYDISDKLFRYTDIIQPILDKRCVKCHNPGKLDLTGTLEELTDDNHVDAKKKFARSYNNLTQGGSSLFSAGRGKYISWLPIFSPNDAIPPNRYGSLVSPLTKEILPNHKSKEGFEITEEELHKIYAWIDLCVPHWGLYNEGYKSSSDSTYYEKAVQHRLKHEAVEAKNIKEFIEKKGGNPAGPIAVRPQDNSSALASVAKVPLRFLASERKLVFVPLSVGELTINDLRGRQLANIRIDKSSVGTSMIVPIPPPISKGVYIARFLDGKKTQSCKFSVIR